MIIVNFPDFANPRKRHIEVLRDMFIDKDTSRLNDHFITEGIAKNIVKGIESSVTKTTSPHIYIYVEK